MAVGAFTDRSHRPAPEEVAASLGPRQAQWQALAQLLREAFGAREDFGFYGRNYGWALRFRKGGQALASLYPGAGGFTVQIVLREAQVAQATALPLGPRARQTLAAATAFAEGRWLFIPVQSARDERDVRRLIQLKAGGQLRAGGRKRGGKT